MTREQGRGALLSAFLLAALALIAFVFIATEGIHKRDDEIADLINDSIVALARGGDRRHPALASDMEKVVKILGRMCSSKDPGEFSARGSLIVSDWRLFLDGSLSPAAFCGELEAFLPFLRAHHAELTKAIDFLLLCSGIALAAAAVSAYFLFSRLQREGRSSERARGRLRETLEIEERERRRIARDLHDDAAQTIAAARMLCERGLASPGEAALRSRSAEASELLREAGLTIRGLVMDLRPPELEAGLGLALESLCARRRASGLGEISVRISEGLPAVSNGAAIQVYRIAQEGLSNAAKHAPGRRVELALCQAEKDGWLRLEIRNGLPSVRGERRPPRPEPSRAAGHAELDTSLSTGNGLSIMSERAELIGGKLEFELAEDGARLSLLFPLGPRKGSTA